MSEYRRLKDIAADIRKNLKAEFPKCKFSIRCELYSMGQSLHVALMSAPFAVLATDPRGRQYAQLNEHRLKEDPETTGYLCNGAHLTPDAWKMLARVNEIVNAENWDRSDSMTDYFDVNYYVHLHIGKWDKPFVVTANKGAKENVGTK